MPKELVSTIKKQHVSIADKWAGKSCTLNNQPAIISGRLCQFGIVAPLNPSHGGGLEWSWEAIDQIMNKTQAFYS